MLKMLCVKMVMFQKMGGMFQEALAMPGPVLSQASPAPSQAIIETTSTTPFSLQGQGAISFSQVGMFFPHILLNHTTCCKFPNISASSIFTHLGSLFPGQWQHLPDATSSGGANKAAAAQPVGVQQHVLFPVREE